MKYTHFKHGTRTMWKGAKGRIVSPKQVNSFYVGIALVGWGMFALAHTAIMNLLAII